MLMCHKKTRPYPPFDLAQGKPPQQRKDEQGRVLYPWYHLSSLLHKKALQLGEHVIK